MQFYLNGYQPGDPTVQAAERRSASRALQRQLPAMTHLNQPVARWRVTLSLG